MKKKIINFLITNIQKYKKYDEIKINEIKYGLETLYLTTTKFIIITIISIIFNFTKELLYLFIFYGLLRLFTSGMHAKNSVQCWIISMLIFILLPLLIKYVIVHKYIIIITYLFILFLIYKYAPSGTSKRNIKNKNKRLLLKYISLFISSLYLFIIIFFANDYLSNILFYSNLLSVIFILPVTYKLSGVEYIKGGAL